jgi:hypothetical protein
MKTLAIALTGLMMLSAPLAASAAPEPAPVKVMVVGVFHMANPGQDIHNLKVDDVTTPQRQAEIERVTAGLARFRPTAVATEWDAATVEERWAKYRAGALPPSRNEVVQLGFRLGRLAGTDRVYGADMDGDFPFETVMTFARANGQGGTIDALMAEGAAAVKAQDELLAREGVAGVLRHLNQPARIRRDHDGYARMLTIGRGAEQPGADLVAAWEQRNLRICARVIQESKPGDRVVVLFGSGHAYLLRRCFAEQPGFELVEANDFLPRR